MNRESFLARWSRRKLAAERGEAVEPDPPKPQAPAAPPAEAKLPAAQAELPSLDSVSLDTGVAAFLRPGVEEGLRRSALKKLFSDSRFNVMDGLDVYVDDYSKPDPIPPDVLARLEQAQRLLHDVDAAGAEAGEPPPADPEKLPPARG